jgi:hypothetical protein
MAEAYSSFDLTKVKHNIGYTGSPEKRMKRLKCEQAPTT